VRVQNIQTGEFRNLAYVERLVYYGEAAFIGLDRRQYRHLEIYEQKRLRFEIARACEDNRFGDLTAGETKRRVWQTLNSGRLPMSGGPRMRTRQFAPIYVPPMKLPEETTNE
jgi:hypothetical protein